MTVRLRRAEERVGAGLVELAGGGIAENFEGEEQGGRQGARSKRRGAGLQGIHRGPVDRGTGEWRSVKGLQNAGRQGCGMGQSRSGRKGKWLKRGRESRRMISDKEDTMSSDWVAKVRREDVLDGN